MIAATQLKVGMVIMHNGKPHRVTHVMHVTPGNWRGMVQTRLVHIETGSNTEHRFRSEDKVERANLEEHNLQYSYRAGDESARLPLVRSSQDRARGSSPSTQAGYRDAPSASQASCAGSLER